MHIVHIAAEIAPIAKVGGLSDVLLGLGRQLVKQGHRVEIILPRYKTLDIEALTDLSELPQKITCNYGGRRLRNRVWRARLDELQLYLIDPIEASGFFQREKIYGFNDDPYRFTYFSLAALEFLKQTARRPAIVHAHDWQTAITAPLLRSTNVGAALAGSRCVFTIHNLAYQGWCSQDVLREAGAASLADTLRDDYHPNQYNLMKGALVHADALTTVSPRFAWEIQTPEGGFGLDTLLRSHKTKLHGILNGIDSIYWDPESDPMLPVRRPHMKDHLRQSLGMSLEDKPLVTCVTRLVTQKGPHLIRRAIERTAEKGGQFVLLGASADPDTQAEWAAFADKYRVHPDIRICLDQGEGFAHQLFAAADMVVVPSLFEPCGLTQMIGLRYGAVPIVRSTGGLADTVRDIDFSGEAFERCNGFVFHNPDSEGVDSALDRALALWQTDRPRWKKLVEQGRQTDHSWERSARSYEDLYRTVSAGTAQTPAAQHWERLGSHPHHGLCVPLFALRSKEGGGIGEYPDLIPLIRWMKSVGFDTLQLLPLNDCGEDPSPYNGLSARALNPVYLRLPGLDAERLNKQKRVDFQGVRELKEAFLASWKDLKRYTKADVETLLHESPWVEEYARFKCLKEGTKATATSIAHHARVQLACREQMSAVRHEADACGIRLVGDLPILLSANSADVHFHPELFDQTYTAGAPPDQYSAKGQNWNFPLYNWQAHKEDNFAWWRSRLEEAGRFFHAYRLDHVVGFFRIWAIPHGKNGRHGFYLPEDPAQWVAQGTEILETFLKASPMLPIGEDLGVIPAEVRACLQVLGIPGLRVMRWEQSPYAAMSMATISTHDSEGLAQWWRDYPQEADRMCRERGWSHSPVLTDEQHRELLGEIHQSNSLFRVNLLQEYLRLVPSLAWSKPEEDRINVPGTVNKRNWTFRYRATVEEIVNSDELRDALAAVISSAGN